MEKHSLTIKERMKLREEEVDCFWVEQEKKRYKVVMRNRKKAIIDLSNGEQAGHYQKVYFKLGTILKAEKGLPFLVEA